MSGKGCGTCAAGGVDKSRANDIIEAAISRFDMSAAKEQILPLPPRANVAPGKRRLYVAFAVLAAIIVFVGFARTFYLNSYFARRDLSELRIVHGTVFSCWILLFLTQVSLVAAKRTDIHRRVGVFGGVLALLMIVVGMAMALNAGKYGFQSPGLPPPLIFLAVPFFDIVVFTTLIAAALYYRTRPEIHKRLMIVATISILPAAFARLPFSIVARTVPFSAFLPADALLLGCVLYDIAVTKRLHRAWLWGGLLFVLSFPLRMWVAGTSAWQTFAQWLVR